MKEECTHNGADIGDYLKLCACTAVILQTILGLALSVHPSNGIQVGIGYLYNFVKFTAPAFIFGILYTTTRTTVHGSEHLSYKQYLKNSWHNLFVPTIWWTSVYLFFLPYVQQVNHYHDLPSFIWQFINGNGAPHLWYNTMMLQFIILMPIFWAIATWCRDNQTRGWIIIGLTVIITACWLWFYDTNVFHGTHEKDWYLFDRLFLSFFIYGVFGTLAWQYRKYFNQMIQKFWWIFLLVFVGSFWWINQELISFGTPVLLTNAPYYKPSMTIYDLAMIMLIAAIALYQINRQIKFTARVHQFAGFAYKAYLSNVLWAQLIWHTFGQSLMKANTIIGIIVIYILTWCLAFASAFGIHFVWQNIKKMLSK
ncbi:acyltransferase family protein [Xylocopilactobacillus apicola]|uniref:Membrane protein n=1 Tax=Xylocopilactobacillus apicola TaxID=2932184 RepID=A0AAU9D515_9LACO|nr:acyltransferase [Xylocopilactobacillus apicola]BDR58573.1 membrane protein [Xylocopilactobacillus apicola]